MAVVIYVRISLLIIRNVVQYNMAEFELFSATLKELRKFFGSVCGWNSSLISKESVDLL
jgi:hypothetical protein